MPTARVIELLNQFRDPDRSDAELAAELPRRTTMAVRGQRNNGSRIRQQTGYLLLSELERLFACAEAEANSRNVALLRVGYSHGLRASEVGLLRLEDLQLSDGCNPGGIVSIRVRRLKGSFGGEYPVHPGTSRAIYAWLEEHPGTTQWLFPARGLWGGPRYADRPIGRRALHEMFQTLARNAGIAQSKCHWHILKHSIAVHLLDAGADITFVQDWLGHVDIRNTAIYAQVSNERRREVAHQLFRSPRLGW